MSTLGKKTVEDIEVKENAPELLEKALRSKRQKCMIGTGAMCDPYLHLEERLLLTRRCLELIDRYEFGVAVQTKSARILRDFDLLASINEKAKAVVQITLTTYDEDLCKKIEPDVSTTKERINVLMKCKEAGIPTVVWLTPILPFINDTADNIKNLLDACVDAGVKGIIFWGIGVTLRDGDREYFYHALDQDFPGMKEKYIRTYGNAYNLPSPNEKMLIPMIVEQCQKAGILCSPDECFAYLHHFPEKYVQRSLFE